MLGRHPAKGFESHFSRQGVTGEAIAGDFTAYWSRARCLIAALLVSGLRIVLPHLDARRPEILNKIESATGMPVEASQLSASWQNFGPTLKRTTSVQN